MKLGELATKHDADLIALAKLIADLTTRVAALEDEVKQPAAQPEAPPA